ncbi:DUF6270 domain-containing protein [Jeotgalicoccus sp. ATCC 8456]|uniref:DUF6270 domain-containing protein n=1 Tax=Jeotgalicoccus sp. ATCC 8456 TaxID=946435 RepID=UPI0018E5DB77|nr:DUF6270 domain-containing protein [Jeotgalicoccus sp. ATCC 8456]QQD85671.1 hypothetical protein JEM45_03335 [Jeotgalicoccus sp. ATCC 8456]
MNIDVYGSRYTLIPLMRSAEELGFNLNKAYLGSSLSSQYTKTQKLDVNLAETRLGEYEQLEVLNDRLKLFRRFSSQSLSEVIVIDFVYEAFEVVTSAQGRLTLTPANQKFDRESTRNIRMTKDSRLNLVSENINLFVKDLNKFDKVILNKLRLPKYIKKTEDKFELRSDIETVNIMNAFIESFEDLLIEKLDGVHVVPLYENHHLDAYWFSQNYLQHFKKHSGL